MPFTRYSQLKKQQLVQGLSVDEVHELVDAEIRDGDLQVSGKARLRRIKAFLAAQQVTTAVEEPVVAVRVRRRQKPRGVFLQV